MTLAHALSIGATLLLFYVAGKHITDLFNPAKSALRLGKRRSFVQILCLSIFIGATGDFLDNAYWGAAWTADGLQSLHPWIASAREFLFKWGVVANIPFRQFSDLVANYGLTLSMIILSEELIDDDDYNVISRVKYHRNLIIVAAASFIIVGLMWWVAS